MDFVHAAGVIDSLFFCVRALTEPTDAILIQPPVYGPFYRAVNNFGRKLALNRLIETEDGWKWISTTWKSSSLRA